MILVACVFLIPCNRQRIMNHLLLVPIAFGMLLVNIYPDIYCRIRKRLSNGVGGLLYYFYTLDEWSILPSLIFLGVGAMTDFGPLIANPISFLLGAAGTVWYFRCIFPCNFIRILMIRQQRLFLSSVVQTDLLLFSLQEN